MLFAVALSADMEHFGEWYDPTTSREASHGETALKSVTYALHVVDKG
jgi:hypothetical protein